MPVTLDPATNTDRVRRYTSPEMLQKIEVQLAFNIQFYSAQSPEVLNQRIEELRQEWSMERYLEVNAATVGLLTVALALTRSKAWALLTGGALGFFLYHALRGFDPPIPLLRRLGVRTRSEIDRELFALKAMRGDFKDVPVDHAPADRPTARQILQAVNS